MSLRYIRDYYGVPANRGQKVIYSGSGRPLEGVITGARGAHLMVRIAEFGERPVRIHPTWEVEFVIGPDHRHGGIGNAEIVLEIIELDQGES